MSTDRPIEPLTKNALGELAIPIFLKVPPETAEVSRASVPAYDNPVDAPRPVDLDEIAKRVVTAFSKGTLPDRRDLRHAAFCVWGTQPHLADRPVTLRTYLQWLSRIDRKADFRRLAEEYVRSFDAQTTGIEEVAATLARCAEKIGGRWGERARDYQIFDPHRGPLEIARVAISQDVDPVHFLRERDQWPESLAKAGLSRSVWLAGIKEIEKITSGNERERFERLTQWNGADTQEILFSSLKAQFVAAVIRPYGNGGPADKSLRNAIVNFLLGVLGDPRLDSHKWIGLDDAVAVMNRWLVEQSFRQFLDIVEKISENEQQWEYRRAFWEGLFKKCQQTRTELHAWVVFAGKGAKAAREIFGSNASFGVFRDGSQALLETHAAFMLEIGDYLFVDWNESGPCNVWRRNTATKRPKLYQDYYRRDQLRHRAPRPRTDEKLIPAGIFDHRGSGNYVWQARIAKEITDAYGPRLYQTDYRVKS
jgi:EH_Signature domain